MQYFVRSGGLIGFFEQVRASGGNASELLREAGLSTGVLHDPDLYLPYTALADLLTLAARHCGDPAFGVRLGNRQGLDVVGALGSVMCLQATLAEALRLMQRNLDFHARGVRVDVDTGDETVGMRMTFAFEDQTDCSQLAALSLALLNRSVSQLHRAPMPPADVRLTLSEPDATAAYAQAFSCPVTFNAGENALVYPARLLELPVDVAPELRQRLSRQWRGHWQQTEPVTLPQQVERAITALLPTGDCSLELVARLLDMHPRSLQKQLRSHRESFSNLLQGTRLQLARHNLENSNIDLTTLAMNLGYAELAVFSRSFKQWTGQPPRQWRLRARNQDSRDTRGSVSESTG